MDADKEGAELKLCEPYLDLETMEINLYDDGIPRPTLHTRTQFQHACQDLVVLTARIWCKPQMVVTLIGPFTHTLRQVNLETSVDIKASSYFETLSCILGTLTGLLRLKFDTGGRFTKE